MPNPLTPDQERAQTFPGGAPDQEVADLMDDLQDLQTWAAVLMGRPQVPRAREAYDLIQRTRALIVERLYSRAIARKAALLERDAGGE